MRREAGEATQKKGRGWRGEAVTDFTMMKGSWTASAAEKRYTSGERIGGVTTDIKTGRLSHGPQDPRWSP